MKNIALFILCGFLVSLTASASDNTKCQTDNIIATYQSDQLTLIDSDAMLLSALTANYVQTDYYAKCCKYCRKGKACGDSCISRKKTCRKGKGCACDAN